MQSGFLSQMQDNSLSRTKCFFCSLFAKAGDFPFIIRGVVLAGFPGPVKIRRAVLSHKSDNNARLFFFNRNTAIFIFSCETGGKHKDSVHRLSPASPLHSVSPLGPLYSSPPNVFLLLFAWHWAPCYPSWTFPGFMYQYKCQPHPLPWIKEQTCTRADPRSPGTVLIPNRGGSTRPCHPLQGNPVPLEAAAAFYQWVSHNSQVLALLWIVMLFISICCAVFFFPFSFGISWFFIWHPGCWHTLFICQPEMANTNLWLMAPPADAWS